MLWREDGHVLWREDGLVLWREDGDVLWRVDGDALRREDGLVLWRCKTAILKKKLLETLTYVHELFLYMYCKNGVFLTM